MTMHRRCAALAICLSLGFALLWGCTTRPLECPSKTALIEIQGYYPQTLETDVDLLFVIDNSNSMLDDQQKLAAQFAKLIDGLRTPKLGKDRPEGPACTEQDRRNCKIPNVRIGVVSSDLGAGSFSIPSCERPGGDGARLQSTPRLPGCTPPSQPWISYENGVTNVAGDGDPISRVKEAFSCIANLGGGGCGFEHQLEAARRALSPKVNPGFLRPQAFLAVVFITDEDDCSASKADLFDPAQQTLQDPLGPLTSFRCTEFGIRCDQPGRQPGLRTNCVPHGTYLHPVEEYVTFFQSLKPQNRALLFAIAGPSTPFEVGLDGANPALKASCQSMSAEGANTAVPALRIESVVRGMGPSNGFFNRGLDENNRPVEVSICSPDYGPALKKIGDMIVAALTEQCVRAPLLTRAGEVACRPGEELAPGLPCPAATLPEADCFVEELLHQQHVGEVPRCPAELFDPQVRSCGAHCPCWRLVSRPECQQSGAPHALEVLRQDNLEPPRGTIAAIRCSASAQDWGNLSASLECR